VDRHAKRALGLALGALVVAGLVALITTRGGGPVRRRPTAVSRRVVAGLRLLPPPAGIELGVNVNRLFDDRTYSQPAIDEQLLALRGTGAQAARADVLWEATEPAAPVRDEHRYNWAFDDQIASSLAAHHVRWMPIVDYAPPWARINPSQPHSPPRESSEFAAFAAALTVRYGRQGSFWRDHPRLPALPVRTYEIWNEPDNPQFWPEPDARRYADLYLRARAAIRSVDPVARPIVGGLVSPSFVSAMVSARPQLRGAIDGVGIHPYGAGPLAVLNGVRAARTRLRTLGLGSVPLYATEFGWTTSPPGGLGYLPAGLRPRYISATLALLGHTDCGLAGVFLYTWVTPERRARNPEDWFGIHPPGGGSSADTRAFTQGIANARRAAATDQLCA
jgi:hypothetical protein